MADYPAPRIRHRRSRPPVSGALLAYGLFGVAAVVRLDIVRVPPGGAADGSRRHRRAHRRHLNRAERRDVGGSHLTWLIRTFWYSLLWGAIGAIFAVTIIGLVIAIPLWAVASIWVIYRVIRGYLLFNDSKPIPGL